MKYPEIMEIPPQTGEFSYDQDYTILYALGLGAGTVPEELRFVYERGLQAIPTLGVMLGNGSTAFIEQGGIDYTRIVHGEQRLTLHKPVAASGNMRSTSRCIAVIDKGADKGAVVEVESEIRDGDSGELVATATSALFCRGDGGCGAPSEGGLPVHPIPDRPHDLEVVLPTIPQQAALYRLLGDKNPLHIDPERAHAVGFERPILHGLCTYGIACRAILQSVCDNDPAMIERFDVRFSAPVFTGEPIATRIWRDGRTLSFECYAPERGAQVIRNGLCQLRG